MQCLNVITLKRFKKKPQRYVTTHTESVNLLLELYNGPILLCYLLVNRLCKGVHSLNVGLEVRYAVPGCALVK